MEPPLESICPFAKVKTDLNLVSLNFLLRVALIEKEFLANLKSLISVTTMLFSGIHGTGVVVNWAFSGGLLSTPVFSIVEKEGLLIFSSRSRRVVCM